MKSFINKDLTERFEFTRAGYRTICICYDKENHKGIWELRKDGSCRGYEVVKGVKTKNPDGSVVYVDPSSEQFGKYGSCIVGKNALNISLEKLKSL